MNQKAELRDSSRKTEITKEIFSPVIKKFQRIQIQTHYKDECWSIDLIDRSSLAKYNKNYKFIFTIIDNHTKYAWAIPLKDKSGKSTTAALKSLIEKEKRKPHKIWSDRGKEFYNTTFLNFLKEQNIQIYSTHSDLKAVFVERFNRTLLDLIKEPMYIEGKGNWLNHINNALDKYNNRVHGTTKMTPFEMSFCAASQSAIPRSHACNSYRDSYRDSYRSFANPIPKFQVGDYVRVPDKRNIYSKGYTTNWNRELFKIHNINKTNPVTYTLNDENGEIIQGKYYEQELLRSIFDFDSNNKTLESMNIFHKFE